MAFAVSIAIVQLPQAEATSFVLASSAFVALVQPSLAPRREAAAKAGYPMAFASRIVVAAAAADTDAAVDAGTNS